MKINKIVIHCSATPNVRYHTAVDVHRWHTERGWSGIGYHYVIRTDGTLDNGRPEYWQGAHASGHNKNSIGICLIGTDEFTPQQWGALKSLITKLQAKYGDPKVIGHNEISEKDCPGFDVQDWLLREGL
jgi:N-acetyl-anhydromuramyl-L-alanine amidase AmpD